MQRDLETEHLPNMLEPQGKLISRRARNRTDNENIHNTPKDRWVLFAPLPSPCPSSFALPHGQTVPEVRGLRLSSSARRAERG